MKERGVTLIELLIAVTLVSALALAGLVALRVGISAMQKSNNRLMANRRSLGAQKALEQQIAGFMPVLAECQVPPEVPPARVPFFEGEPQSMRFVSTYSLEGSFRGMPHILEYSVIQGGRGEGVRLVVTEYLYTGARSAGAFCLGMMQDPVEGVNIPRWLPVNVGPSAFVLADRLASCRILYRETLPTPPFERWTSRWALPRWPTAVRIEMQPLEPDPSRLQPMTLTAPVRAQRIPGVDYGQ